MPARQPQIKLATIEADDRGSRATERTTAQLDALSDRLRPTWGYLSRLQKPIDMRVCPDNDRLVLFVRNAQGPVSAALLPGDLEAL